MPVPRLSPQQIQQFTDWLAAYIREQRICFRENARPIPPDLATTLQAFFPQGVLSNVRIVRGTVSQPSFYPQLRAIGISNAPSFTDMAGITFQDVVVHVEPLTKSLLFHELVHAVQYKHLGLTGFAERYVRGFLSGGSYEEIPLEKQAYGLEDRFAQNPRRPFSVEEDVIDWIRRDQF